MPQHVYGNGGTALQVLTQLPTYYDRAGIKSANRTNIFQQFADKSMPRTKVRPSKSVSGCICTTVLPVLLTL